MNKWVEALNCARLHTGIATGLSSATTGAGFICNPLHHLSLRNVKQQPVTKERIKKQNM